MKEELKEINELNNQQLQIDKLLKHLPSLDWMEGIGSQKTVGIKDSDNNRYTLRNIYSLLGHDKFYQLLKQFENSLKVELILKKESVTDKLNQYTITKNPLK